MDLVTPSKKGWQLRWPDIYVVGGGPSLRSFDFEKLRGRKILAVNDSAFAIPFASALFSIDARWIHNRRDEINNFPGHIFLACDEGQRNVRIQRKARWLRRVRDQVGFSPYYDAVHMGGGNSGFAAINMALHLGARRIVLMGFDFSADRDRRTHWHGGYRWNSDHIGKVHFNWAGRLDQEAATLARRGVEVLVAGSFGRLKAFRRVPFDSLPLPELTAEDPEDER